MARPFVPAVTRSILDHACYLNGLDGAGAALLRHGENAIYQLASDPVIVRISRHADVPQHEVVVARWLADLDFPAARLLGNLPQLQQVDGYVITWWELIDEAPPRPRFVDLALALRRLHELPPPQNYTFPEFDPMPRVLSRVAAAGSALSDADREFLTARHDALRGAFESLSFQLDRGPIHGDAHLGNLMRRSNRTVVVIDFEAFMWGPREWDVSVIAAAHKAFDWMEADEYHRCVAAYGWDPLTWDGFMTTRAVRELNMVTWLVQRAGESADVDREIALRLADLRNDDLPRRWRQL